MHSQMNLIDSYSAFCHTRIFTVHYIYDLLTCNSCLWTPICKRCSVTCKGLRHWQCYRQAAAQVAARLKPSSQLRSWNSYEMLLLTTEDLGVWHLCWLHVSCYKTCDSWRWKDVTNVIDQWKQWWAQKSAIWFMYVNICVYMRIYLCTYMDI